MKLSPLVHVIFTVGFTLSLHAQSDSGFLPMKKGTVWIYAGSVAWQEDSQIRRRQLSWKSEVLESVQRGRFKVALLLGHPDDLAWYERGRQRRCHVLTAVGDHEFYLHAVESRCALPENSPVDFVKEDDLILKAPAKKGESFGGDPQRNVNDGLYKWHVEDQKLVKPKGIKGVRENQHVAAYVLAYRAVPDHQAATYLAGIGLAEYVYSHHGTVSEVSMHLVEVRY